jgi:CPA1 family monovalent cation:H+ antiporter
MAAIVETVLLMAAVLVIVAVVARRLRTPPSILLVIAGVVLALVPGLPRVELAPELVLFGILPPLIYAAGVAMSWREFRFNLRPIALLGFGLVVFTACLVAAATHLLLGLPWAVGLVLGAIIGPPDIVAPLAIARRLGVPRRILVVLEGEGLVNDATALVLYRFAVAAVSAGAFSLGHALVTFSALIVGEIAWGIAVGWLSLRLRRWARDPRVEITMSLMTPYIAYLVPEQLGGSGVLACVATGLYVSWNGPLSISSATRLQGIFFWDLVVYLVEGMVFLLTGLQARVLLERPTDTTLHEVVRAILVTSGVAVGARFLWTFPASYIPRWLSRSLARRDPRPPWQATFMVAFTGIRGVVSLAAALAIPLTIASGAPFPHRDLILFTTFGVIVASLVLIGLLLPLVVTGLGLTGRRALEDSQERADERAARRAAIEVSQSRLRELTEQRQLSDRVLASLRARHVTRALGATSSSEDGSGDAALRSDLLHELIRIEREEIFQLLRDGKLTDESRRRLERELDLEETTLAHHEGESEPPL